MNSFDKLDKLEENLSKRMGFDDDDVDSYVYCCFIEGKISVRKVVNGEDSDPVEVLFNDSWTLEDWKTFRDRCLQELR
jgi:hypothetical protein